MTFKHSGAAIRTYHAFLIIAAVMSFMAIAASSRGQTLYVCSNGTDQIYTVSSSLASTLFSSNNGPEGTLTTDSSGTLWSSDYSYSLIRRFNADGTCKTFAALGETPFGIAAGTDGYIYYGDYVNGNIYKMDKNGNSVLFTHLFNGGGSTPSRLEGLRFGPDGTLYACQTNGFTSSLDIVWKIAPNGAATPFSYGYADYDVAAAPDASGNLFVTDYGHGEIWKVAPNASVSLFASGLSHPTDIIVDDRNNLDVAEDGAILQYANEQANAAQIFGDTNYPNGLAFSDVQNETPEPGTTGLITGLVAAGLCTRRSRFKVPGSR